MFVPQNLVLINTLLAAYSFFSDKPLQNSSEATIAEYNQTKVIIECDVCANPEPLDGNYTWSVNGAVLTEVQSQQKYKIL